MDICIVQLRQRAERPVLDPLSRRSLRCSCSGRAMPVSSVGTLTLTLVSGRGRGERSDCLQSSFRCIYSDSIIFWKGRTGTHSFWSALHVSGEPPSSPTGRPRNHAGVEPCVGLRLLIPTSYLAPHPGGASDRDAIRLPPAREAFSSRRQPTLSWVQGLVTRGPPQ